MGKSRTPAQRIPREPLEKFKALALEVSYVQKKNVSVPETLRRIANIPNLKDILLSDAELKRFKRI